MGRSPEAWATKRAHAQRRHDRLLEQFMALGERERLALLDSLDSWRQIADRLIQETEAFLERGQAFSDDLTVALALVEYARPGTRPQARMGALRMIESIQRRRTDAVNKRISARLRELEGIEKGWLSEQDRAVRQKQMARRKAKEQKERAKARDEQKAALKAEAKEALVDDTIKEHLG